MSMDNTRIWATKDNLEEYLNQYPDHRQRYEFAEKFVRGMEVADISCGTGYGTYMLSRVAKSVVGYDIADEALKYANDNFKDSNIEYRHGDEFTQHKYDLVISFETIEHMDELAGDDFLKQINGVLPIGGKLIISTPIFHSVNGEVFNTESDFGHLKIYTTSELKDKLIKHGFIILESWGLGNTVFHGGATAAAVTAVFKSGLHKLIPKFLRSMYARNNIGSIMTKDDNWDKLDTQLYVCEKR